MVQVELQLLCCMGTYLSVSYIQQVCKVASLGVREFPGSQSQFGIRAKCAAAEVRIADSSIDAVYFDQGAAA